MVTWAIDPGTEQSALLVLEGDVVRAAEILPNEQILRHLRPVSRDAVLWPRGPGDVLAVEMIASYGMAIGRETFETCLWIGRFIERWGGAHEKVYRKDVKMHLCHSMRAKDANIRQALLDRFGPGKKAAVGTKTAPGPLYGVRTHLWAALAVAVTFQDQRIRAAA